MKWVSCLSALIVLAPSIVNAAPAATCKTAANGHWVVTSYFFNDGIIAVGPEEARKNLGSKVSISKDQVIFLGETCNVAKVLSMKSRDYPKYPLGVDVSCKNKVFLPAFFVANACDRMLAASGDGVNYILRRK
jgi:hypothetical protein